MKTIGYWTTTVILGLVLLSGGAAQLARRPENIAGLAQLGYPAYLASILGFWKMLGAIALLAPGLPRLKEWAYAGSVFLLTGAAASHAVSGDPAARVIVPLVFAMLALVSWALRPQTRILGGWPRQPAA